MANILTLLLLVLPIIEANELSTKGTEILKNGTTALVIPMRTTLDDLLRQFNITDKPEYGRNKRSTCEISGATLQQLAESIRQIANYFPKPGDPPLASMSNIDTTIPETGTACERAKVKLANNVDQLTKVYFIMLINGTQLTESEYVRVKQLYDKLNTTIQDDFRTIQETLGDESKIEIAEVIQEKNELELRLQRIIKDLEYNMTIQQKLRENILELVVAEIDRGSYKNAQQKFLELANPDLIHTVVEKMEKKPNDENLIRFIKDLPWLSHRVNGFNAMLKSPRDLKLAVFSIDYAFNELMNSNNDATVVAENQEIIDEIRKKLNVAVERVYGESAQKVVSTNTNDFNELTQYSRNHEAAFNAHLETLIQKVYENTNNNVDLVERISIFSDNVKTIAQSARINVKLYKLMEENQDISFESTLKIAQKMKKLSLMKNHVNTPPDVTKEMDALKDRVPQSIKDIIWGTVCIKNPKLNVYLYENGTFDSERSVINLSPTDRTQWYFESTDNGNTFRIRDSKKRQVLYAENDQYFYSPYKRRVFGWRRNIDKLSGHEWIIENLNWLEGKFYIKNQERKEYLNAEQLPEQEETDKDFEAALATLTSKGWPLANAVKSLIKKKLERLQAFTWSRQSRGHNPEWLFIKASDC